MRRMSMRSLPIPMITAPGRSCRFDTQRLRASLLHQRAHSPDRAVEPAEDRFADEEMPDIELDDGQDRGNRTDGIVSEPVSGMTLQAERFGFARAADDPVQLADPLCPLGLAISTGMQFDNRSTDGFRGL